jgi:hypothetical protein
MSKITEAGQKIANIRKSSNLNARRVKENFIQPSRIVDNFNIIHPYSTTFTAKEGASASLSLKFDEITTPCTINPPLLHIATSAYFNGDSPGTLTELFNTSQALSPPGVDPPIPDFTLDSGGVVVPVDGCYSVFWNSGSWGVGYFSDKLVTVTVLRRTPDGNLYPIRSIGRGPTGVTALLGPLIYSYTPVSPLYAVVECKAGDAIVMAMNQGGIGDKYPWYNGGLTGFFDDPLNGSGITVTLVAVAEK